ncbi:MAG TPA: DEAD/DEAH box helicase [Vicinamibacterales bacterium]|nr:DEAD/DEAH box helicase [Vicinamibacterales bacterium]
MPLPTYSGREQAPYDPSPRPFSAFGLSRHVQQALHDMGFLETRPVQSAVLPYALAGDDVMASAETGSGKTLAFVIPILERLLADADHTGTRALILAPTRELAVQIEDAIQGLTYHTPVTSVAVYGGVAMHGQERALRAGVNIIVATPGRLMDHMRAAAVDFSRLSVFVLDEADRMMDMGFWPDVQRIVQTLPARRQTLLFSATLSDEVLTLTKGLVSEDARYVQIGRAGGPAETITHTVHTLPPREKVDWLARFLRDTDGPTLVFVRTKIGAERLARDLQRLGVRATALHGDRSQSERLAAVEGFRSGRIPVLVATDLAARGLDIEGITHVVNFELPDTPEAYVHRVGRTGRDRTAGTAVTLVAPDELRALRALEKAVGIQLQ